MNKIPMRGMDDDLMIITVRSYTTVNQRKREKLIIHHSIMLSHKWERIVVSAELTSVKIGRE